MIVDLTTIEGATEPFDFVISPAEIDIEDGNIMFAGELRAAGEVVKHAAQIDVRGGILGRAQIDCTRCLKPVDHELKIDFSVSFVTPEDFAADKEREVLADDLDTDVLASDRIDLQDVVREQILLNIPEQLFCKPDCKGLCPKCGEDLNLIDCKCDDDEVDPRWSALKELRG